MIIKRGLYTDYINKVITAPAGAAYLYINDKNSGGVCYKNEKNSGEASLKNEKSSGEASRNNDEYFKILCIGNSYTSDCTTYVPALLEDIAGVKIVMGKTYYKGARITQYIDWFDDDSAVITYTKYDPEASVWSEKIFDQTLKSAIADEDWDVITFSPGSGDIKGGTPSMVNTLINKVTKYYAAVHGKKEVKIGWLMPQMRPLELRKGITYEKCISMVQKILSQTPVEFVIPCITAIENARGTSLNSLGDYGSLAHDTAGHLQAGIPSLVTSYTTAMSIMKLLGKDYNEIQQKEIRPTDEWIESQNAPHHGDSVGVNEKNCYIALKCAIAAMKSPYKISIISESEF